MGYAISGSKITCGLLGATTLNATVKNLAMIDVGITHTNNLSVGGLLADIMTGTTTIENVYLKMSNPDGFAVNVGVWARGVKGTLNANNVVSYVNTDRANMNALIVWNQGCVFNLSNVYCGSACTMNLVTTGAAPTLSTRYTTLAAMKTAYANKEIDISWASGFAYYSSLQAFLTA